MFIPVIFRWQNRKEYIDLVIEYKRKEFITQMEAIRAGMTSLIPTLALSLFGPKELENRICGDREIDINLLKVNHQGICLPPPRLFSNFFFSYSNAPLPLQENTTYSGAHSATAPHIINFWAALEEMTAEQRRKFVSFVWGRETIPAAGQKWDARLHIMDFGQRRSRGRTHAEGEMDSYLPASHTCSFGLELPIYSSKEVTKDRLLYAIQNVMEYDLD